MMRPKNNESSDWRSVHDFLAGQPLAAISTIDMSGTKPQSALIAFAETAELEIIFETFTDSRKFHNLQSNPSVSLVIGWDAARYITVQYEGRAQPVSDAEIEACKQILLAKNTPCTPDFLNDSRARLFKILPSFIRYSDYTGSTPRILELHF